MGDGGRAIEGHNKQKEDDDAVAVEDVLGFESHFSGEEANEDLASIEGVDGDEVEDGQHDVESDGFGDNDLDELEGGGGDKVENYTKSNGECDVGSRSS